MNGRLTSSKFGKELAIAAFKKTFHKSLAKNHRNHAKGSEHSLAIRPLTL
jgi:hypothetical protein